MTNLNPASLPKPSKQEVDRLRQALAAQSVTLPEPIVGIETGVYGICFLTKQGVFKLFVIGNQPDYWRNHFSAGVRAYQYIEDVKDELARRNVQIPVMKAHGWLSPHIAIGHHRFHAWYLTTRLEGAPILPRPEMVRRDKDMISGDKIVKLTTLMAAKYHVQVKADGKDIRTPFNTDWVNFHWLPRARLRGKMAKRVAVLRADIKRLTPPVSSTTTFLHGDLGPRNFIRSANGTINAIDWDQQKFGLPELDLYGIFSSRPQRIHHYCLMYNQIATGRIDEKRVVAYALALSLGIYFHHFRDAKIRYSSHRKKTVLKPIGLRIAQLADRLHQLTAKQAYREMAQRFAAPTTYVKQSHFIL